MTEIEILREMNVEELAVKMSIDRFMKSQLGSEREANRFVERKVSSDLARHFNYIDVIQKHMDIGFHEDLSGEATHVTARFYVMGFRQLRAIMQRVEEETLRRYSLEHFNYNSRTDV